MKIGQYLAKIWTRV